jgi:hypothetical protein
VLTHLHFNVFAFMPLSSALTQLLITNLIWYVFSYGMVIVILSVGRRGIDVMLLRAMLVAFLLGVAFIALTPLVDFVPRGTWILTMLISGLTSAALAGPVFGVYATVANLIWYRSPRSLRPQIAIFNPR